MPKIKSKLPANINTNISAVVTTPIISSTSPAPVASSSVITHSIDYSSSQFDEIFTFPNKYLNDEENSLINNPPYKLTLSLQELLPPARKFRKDKNNSQNKIPRPQNAWVLFRKDYEANQRMKFPDKTLKMKNVSTDAGEVWRNQPINTKRYFETLSKLAHEQHKILYPNYKYTPKKKSSKENLSKDWIFRDGSVGSVQQSPTVTNPTVTNHSTFIIPAAESHVNDDDSGSAATTVHLMNDDVSEFESPSYISSSLSSSPESCHSPIIINSPTSPSETFISPVDTPNDLGLYFASVTSILTYSGETLASSSSSAYYNYQQNVAVSNDSLTSNLNNLNFTNSDYETYQHLMMNLADNYSTTNDEILINNDIVDENYWQFSSTHSDSVNSFDLLQERQHAPVVTPTYTLNFLVDDPSLFENGYNNNNNNNNIYYFGTF